jgi:hypothetical protein
MPPPKKYSHQAAIMSPRRKKGGQESKERLARGVNTHQEKEEAGEG